MDEHEVRFCTRCGAETRLEDKFGRPRPVCPRCGWIYFADPKVAAAALVEDGPRVLLVRRVNDPHAGRWTIPAGFIDAGEDPARAAERECLEETGLRVQVMELANLISGREHAAGADLVLVYRTRVLGGQLQAGDDADRAQFFSRDSLPPLAFRATRVALGLPPEPDDGQPSAAGFPHSHFPLE